LKRGCGPLLRKKLIVSPVSYCIGVEMQKCGKAPAYFMSSASGGLSQTAGYLPMNF